MEDIWWKFVVPVYPVHYNRVTRTILQNLSSQLNKFVPELGGLLMEYDKNTLRISSSMDMSTLNGQSYQPKAQVAVAVKPELPALHIRGQIRVRVFYPRFGLELTGTVSALQPHQVFCKTDMNDVMIAVARCADTGMCKVESTLKNNENQQTVLELGDVIRVRLSSVTRQLGSFILRGELVAVISRATAAPKAVLDKFGSPSSNESDVETADTVREKGKKKKTKIKNSSEVSVKIDESGVVLCIPKEPSSPTVKSRKRRKSASTSSDNPEVAPAQESLIKPEPLDVTPSRKKTKLNCRSVVTEPSTAVSSETIQTNSESVSPPSKRSRSFTKTIKKEEIS